MYTILLIDDHEMVAEALAYVLELEGFEVNVASNGRQGITLAHTNNPDLIVSDFYMSEVSGIDVLNAVRQNPDMKHIPFILLSMEDRAWIKERGLENGADAVVHKSHRTEQLISEIKRLLDKSAKRTKPVNAGAFQ